MVPQHAVDYLIERVLTEPTRSASFPIGPLTNIAMAIRKEPRVVEAVKELVIMGGAILEHGNGTPQASSIFTWIPMRRILFSIPGFRSPDPLDVTHKCLLKQEHVDRLMRIDSPISRFIRDAMEVYLDASLKLGYEASSLHDPLTLATIMCLQLLTLKEYYVDVDISGGVSMGKTFADITNVLKRPANMKVAMGVRGEDFVELFLQRMETLSRKIGD